MAASNRTSWMTLAKYIFGTLDAEWRARDEGFFLVRKLRTLPDGMTVVGRHVWWLSSAELLLDLIARAGRLGLEPNPDSLRRTSS